MDSRPNIAYMIDPQTLREIPEDPDAMRRALAYYLNAAEQEAADTLIHIKSLGMAGSIARILEELELSESLLRSAIQLAEENGHSSLAFVNRIRLAHTLQWQKEFAVSTALFAELLATVMDGYHDFVLQHAGKNAFDMGDYARARNLFRDALRLRQQMGKADLIESTQIAIQAVERRLKESRAED